MKGQVIKGVCGVATEDLASDRGSDGWDWSRYFVKCWGVTLCLKVVGRCELCRIEGYRAEVG